MSSKAWQLHEMHEMTLAWKSCLYWDVDSMAIYTLCKASSSWCHVQVYAPFYIQMRVLDNAKEAWSVSG